MFLARHTEITSSPVDSSHIVEGTTCLEARFLCLHDQDHHLEGRFGSGCCLHNLTLLYLQLQVWTRRARHQLQLYRWLLPCPWSSKLQPQAVLLFSKSSFSMERRSAVLSLLQLRSRTSAPLVWACLTCVPLRTLSNHSVVIE